MKTIVCAAASLLTSSLLLACPVSAQTQESPEAAQAPAPAPSVYETGFQDGMRAAVAYFEEHMKSMHGAEESGGEPGGGPRVRLAKGNAMIALKCSADDSTEDCVNAAIILLDHAAGEKKETAQAKTPAQGPGTPPPPALPGGPGAPQPH